MALTIGMVAHDRKKPDLAAWAQEHLDLIARHKVVATATTGLVSATGATTADRSTATDHTSPAVAATTTSISPAAQAWRWRRTGSVASGR